MIGAGAREKGLTTAACCFATSSVSMFLILRGRPITLIKVPNRTKAVTTSGAM